MEFGFDQHGLLAPLALLEEQEGAIATPDWLSLKARFAALHALFQELLEPFHAGAQGGAFMASGSAVLARQREGSSDVNRDALGNGKTRAAKAGGIASHPDSALGKPHE